MANVWLSVSEAKTPYEFIVENLNRLNEEMVKKAAEVFGRDSNDYEAREEFHGLMVKVGTFQRLKEEFIRNGWSD